jgi:hypothetical protein
MRLTLRHIYLVPNLIESDSFQLNSKMSSCFALLLSLSPVPKLQQHMLFAINPLLNETPFYI